MFNHQDIWDAIDRLAEEKGYSPSGLARAAGLDPTTFNKSKRAAQDGKLRWPSTESLSKILFVTQCPIEEFVALMQGVPYSASNGGTARQIPYFTLHNIAAYPDTGEKIIFPDPQGGQNLYAFEVTGDDNAPILNDGDVLILSPEAEIRKNDKILIHLKTGQTILCFYRRAMADKLIYSPLKESTMNIEIPIGDCLFYHRILWCGIS